MEKYRHLVWFTKKIFWLFNLPCLGLVSIYCIATHQIPLDSLLFNFAVGFCIPYLMIKVAEYRKKTMQRCHEEFDQLTDEEIINIYKKIKTARMGQQNALFREVLEQELQKRFHNRN